MDRKAELLKIAPALDSIGEHGMAEDARQAAYELSLAGQKLKVERYTIEKLHWCFRDVEPGAALTRQQRAWLDKLFQEAARGEL